MRLSRTLCLLAALAAVIQAADAPPPISKKTDGMSTMPGYFPLYWDEHAGKLYLEIDKWNTELLYVHSLPAGLGSNDIGLDRGQLGRTRIVKFERSGPKVLLVQPNYRFRALTDNPAERAAVEQAFARSVVWGFTVQAEESGRALVDATDFYLRDAHDVIRRLQAARQGTYRLDGSRSAFYLERTKNFPKNTEVEATLTFTGEPAGGFVREVAPSADSLTVRQHHSFVELPGPGYRPRAFDPRAGYFDTDYMDYSTPVSEPIVKRFIVRHRLAKRDPDAPVSAPVKPIVYYLDPGVPEPIRSALLDGARWWNQAFEAAGYRDAFRVEMLPADADPMDVRYNLIQWVHRSTRGWSYGATIADPRTGEIIKGQVTLGSLRVRQDFLIAEGLLAPYETGRPAPPAMLEMALARLRQLSAHEVGHTLGLGHNYIASTRNRASVMDYPHPWIKLPDEAGREPAAPDLSDAYATGVGEWDKIAIAWGYSDFAPGADERRALASILDRAHARGLRFLTDIDARPPGSAHPETHLWDSGANAVDELKRILSVRERALARFSEKNIREGAPMSTLEDVLVPIYLLHRYQTEAAAKVLGGVWYSYALRGDGQKILETVPAVEQRRALAALVETLAAEKLAVPQRILSLIPRRPAGYEPTRELFRKRTGATFDPLSAAESAAGIGTSLILNRERAARLVSQSALDAKMPGLEEVIDALVAATWKQPRRAGYVDEVGRAIDQVVLEQLFAVAADDAAAPQVRAVTSLKLEELRQRLAAAAPVDRNQLAHYRWAQSRIKRFLDDPRPVAPARALDPPPGQPIGMDDECQWAVAGDWTGALRYGSHSSENNPSATSSPPRM